jgi:dTDP-4-dehydrorhamnose 3,5-epimerase
MWPNADHGNIMKILPVELPDVALIEPALHRDERGLFYEAFNSEAYSQAGLEIEFVQDNISRSGAGVLRGLHYQIEKPQGKLVTVLSGSIFDVAVDLRRQSKTFGRWAAVELTGHNHKLIWIPPGFAHGFYVLSEGATVFYKVTQYYVPELARTLSWDDPTVGIDWPVRSDVSLILNDNDRSGLPLSESQVFEGERWL